MRIQVPENESHSIQWRGQISKYESDRQTTDDLQLSLGPGEVFVI